MLHNNSILRRSKHLEFDLLYLNSNKQVLRICKLSVFVQTTQHKLVHLILILHMLRPS